MIAYKFITSMCCSNAGYEEPWVIGETRTYQGGRVKLCRRGYHTSSSIWDAFGYVATCTLMVADVTKDATTNFAHHDQPCLTKQVSRKIRVITILKIERQLREFLVVAARHGLEQIQSQGFKPDQYLFTILDGIESHLSEDLRLPTEEERRSTVAVPGNDGNALRDEERARAFTENIVTYAQIPFRHGNNMDDISIDHSVANAARSLMEAEGMGRTFYSPEREDWRAYLIKTFQEIVLPKGPPKDWRLKKGEWYEETVHQDSSYLRRLPKPIVRGEMK